MLYSKRSNAFARVALAGAIVSVAGAQASAAISTDPYIWSGASAANDFFATGANWVGGSAPSFGGRGMPSLTSMIFQGDASMTDQPDMNGLFRTGADDLYFNTAGWTIRDDSVAQAGGFRFDDIDADGTTDVLSQGAGVNRLDVLVSFAQGGVNADNIIEVGAGNTLVFGKSIDGGSETLMRGDGTIVLEGPDDTAANFNAVHTVSGNVTVLLNTIWENSGSNFNGPNTRIGGTGGLIGQDFQTTTFAGATLAPGGNGTYGVEIESFLLAGESATVRHEYIFDAGTSVEIQLGTSVGVNDQILINSFGGGNLAILSGVTLDLLSTGMLADGDYTIIQNLDPASDDIVGTFDTVTFDGAPADPAGFSLTYNPDSIVLTVTTVPEPATLTALGFAGLLMRRRR